MLKKIHGNAQIKTNVVDSLVLKSGLHCDEMDIICFFSALFVIWFEIILHLLTGPFLPTDSVSYDIYAAAIYA